MRRTFSILVLGAMVLAGACASDGTTDDSTEAMGAEGGAENATTTSSEMDAFTESSRERTERRLQLERSVDQWWIAFQRQEYGKSDGIAAALETYVNDNFVEVNNDVRTASPRFRKVAAAALGFSGKQEAVPILIAALEDPFADVILAALLALRHLAVAGVDVPTAPIVPYLGHSDDQIRSNAAMVLTHATEPGQGELYLPLTGAMEDNVASVRSHAAAALGKLGDPGAVPFLIRGLEDDKALVRIRCAFALGRIGDRRAVPALIARLDDPEVDVSKAAHKALRAITGHDIPRLRGEWDAYWREQPTDGK